MLSQRWPGPRHFNYRKINDDLLDDVADMAWTSAFRVGELPENKPGSG